MGRLLAPLLGCVLLSSFGVRASTPATADLILRGGTVIDGTGAPRRRADVAVRDGLIVAIGADLRIGAATTIDARGLVVAPGFIDAHNHSDADMAQPAGSLNARYVRQGVTTVVGGPDGEHSPAAIEGLVKAYRRHGIGTNVAFYVGHNGIRREVLKDDQQRSPTAAELEAMKALAVEGMRLGALGLSSGLMYTPGLFSTTDEVAALAKAVAPYGAVYETHVRDPHRGLLKSNTEAIEIGRRAGVPVQLTHATAPGKDNRGLMHEVIRAIEAARVSGVNVVTDQYPYPAVATIALWGVLDYPAGAETSIERARAALRDPSTRAAIRRETLSGGADGFSHFKASGPNSLLILACPGCEQYENRFVAEVAAERGLDGLDAAIDLVLQPGSEGIVASLGGFYEEDMQLMMRQRWTMIASDGAGDLAPERAPPFGAEHPRSLGTFPRVLGRYVRELKLLSLEEAVRKMTSAPADFLGLKGRGHLAPGAAADIVAFDPARIADRSTWAEPTEPPVGVTHVLVNGDFVVRNGHLTKARPGHFLRKGQGPGQR